MSVARLTNRPTYKTALAYAVEHVIRQTTSKEPILAYISTLYSVPEGFIRHDFDEALGSFFEAKAAKQKTQRRLSGVSGSRSAGKAALSAK